MLTQAFGKNITIKIEVEPETVRSEGGILMPASKKPKNRVACAKVINVGQEVAPDIKEGKEIMYDRFEVQKFIHNEEEYAIVHEDKVFGVVIEK